MEGLVHRNTLLGGIVPQKVPHSKDTAKKRTDEDGETVTDDPSMSNKSIWRVGVANEVQISERSHDT